MRREICALTTPERVPTAIWTQWRTWMPSPPTSFPSSSPSSRPASRQTPWCPCASMVSYSRHDFSIISGRPVRRRQAPQPPAHHARKLAPPEVIYPCGDGPGVSEETLQILKKESNANVIFSPSSTARSGCRALLLGCGPDGRRGPGEVRKHSAPRTGGSHRARRCCRTD